MGLCFGVVLLDMLLFLKPLQIYYIRMIIYIREWMTFYFHCIEILNCNAPAINRISKKGLNLQSYGSLKTFRA